MKRSSLLTVLGVLFLPVFAQVDSFSVMQYNLLNYRNHYNECNSSTNNASQKDQWLKVLLDYHSADILSFNEMAARPSVLDSLESEVISKLNKTYQAADYGGQGYLANAFFFNTDKFKLLEQHAITQDLQGEWLVRSVDVYHLYFNDLSALSAGDTTFLICYVAHLKAGSTMSDLIARQEATEAIMAYHLDHKRGDNYNYMLMGDLNVKAASEGAYEVLSQYDHAEVRFYDPLEQAGPWNSNSSYAALHTQSTRSSDTNDGCFSGGGLDDRFDFILCGAELFHHSNHMSYVPGSYQALGNDGQHFNTNIKTPANQSVPSEILNALYEMSDHLPLVATFVYHLHIVGVDQSERLDGWVANPIRDRLYLHLNHGSDLHLQLYSSQGVLVWEKISHCNQGVNFFKLPLLPAGMYTLELHDGILSRRKKVIKM